MLKGQPGIAPTTECPAGHFFFGDDVARKNTISLNKHFFAKKSLILYLAVVTPFSKGVSGQLRAVLYFPARMRIMFTGS